MCIAFSRIGHYIASGSDDGAIGLWDTTTGLLEGWLEGHSDSILSVAFSPDGTLLTSWSSDKTIRIWDVSAHNSIGEPLEGHSDCVNSVTFSPDGTRIASGSSDKSVRIWDIHVEAAIGRHSFELAASAGFPPERGPSPSSLQQSTTADPHPSLLSMRNLEDGWIVGPEGELILWIPPAQRLGLGEVRMLAVLGNPNAHLTLLNFDKMVSGTAWAECRSIDF